MRFIRFAVLFLFLAPGTALAAGDDHGRARPPAGREQGTRPVRSRRPALEGQRLGLVPHSERVRAVEPLAGRGARRRIGPMRARASFGPGGWRLGSPYWTGPSNRIAVRTSGRVTRVRAYYVRSPVKTEPRRAVSIADSPLILSRASWGANERIRRGRPRYADAVRFAVVHHTAGSNSYTRAQSASIVRGIQRYHVLGNGWDDIGYNFLVDKYGQIFEGRYGGVDRNVVGAHAQGFNTGSSGIALIGTYEGSAPSAAARSALARLHRLATRRRARRSALEVQLALDRQPALPGGPQPHAAHDLGPPRHGLHHLSRKPPLRRAARACSDRLPDRAAEALLPAWRPARPAASCTSRRRSPKRSRGRWSSPSRAATSSRPGRGSARTWTGRGTPGRSRPGVISYAIDAGPTVRPATGAVSGTSTQAALTALARPALITPNGDGRRDIDSDQLSPARGRAS